MTRSARISIDGLEFDPITQTEVIERIDAQIQKTNPAESFRVVKPYVEFFEPAQNDDVLHKALLDSDLVVADSVAIQWAASWLAEPQPTILRFVWSLTAGLRSTKWLSRRIPERGEGATATHQLLLASAQHGWKIGILGGADSTELKLRLMERYPLLQIAGVWNGYFDIDTEPELVKGIKSAKLDLLFVALGFPKQELFMQRHVKSHLAKVLLGEGGTFDFDEMGGPLKRAPGWMRRSGLEWLWRLILQPLRLKRQLAIPRFMWRIFRQSRTSKKSHT